MKPDAGRARGAREARTVELTGSQKLAVWRREPYVLVSASAGTGKTHTLIARVLGAVRSQLPLDRLLVVTFTQKAAQQIKDRLYEAFSDDARLRPQRLLLPQSHVATIDSFCARLLRENALAAGIDPSFRVLSDPYDQLVITELLSDIFHHWYLGRPRGEPEDSVDWAGIPARGSSAHREFLRLVELCRYRGGQELLKLEIQHLLRLARTHRDPDAFIEQLAAGLERDPPPYIRAFADKLAHAWRWGVALYEEMVGLAVAEFPDRKLAQHEKLLKTLQTAPPPWGGSADPDAVASSGRGVGASSAPSPAAIGELGDAIADDLPRAITALCGHLVAAGNSQPGVWSLEFPRLPGGTKQRLGPWNDLAKALIGKPPASATPGPFGWLPERPEEITGQYGRTRSTLHTLLELLRQLMTAYESYKQERGLCDFADLELHAHRLLTAPPEGLTQKFAMVMVDEFQDVNHLQADIIRLLEPSEGRFLVGDVKQCIYQFRLSDPSIFRSLFEGAEVLAPPDGEQDDRSERPPTAHPEPPPEAPLAPSGAERVRIYLARNFRSRYPVLQVVNTLFDALFTPGMIGGEYAPEALAFGALKGLAGQSGRSLLGKQPRVNATEKLPDCGARGWAPVEIHLLDQPVRETRLPREGAIALEARIAAERIRDLIESRLPIYDESRGAWRPVRPGDIAILLRSPTPTGTAYARALRAHGIPVAYGGRDFFARQEVRDFLSLARTLDNAHDDVHLAAVLRTPGFDFSDADLARLRMIWPQSHYLIAALRATASGEGTAWSGPPGRPAMLAGGGSGNLVRKCRQFLAALDRWRRLAQSGDLSTALTAALEESGVLDVAAAMDSGAERVGNLHLLLAHARRYAQEQDHNLAGLLEHLAAVEFSGGLESVAAEEGAADAVRLLSLHKAKGLEFPVVVLALLGRRFNDADASRQVLTGEEWLGVDILDPEEYVKTPTVAHRALARMRRDQILEEEIRILYVACTRAREKLIVTGMVPKQWEPLLAELEIWRSAGRVPAPILYRAGRPIDWILGVLHRANLLAGLDEPGVRVDAAGALEITRHSPEALPAAAESATADEIGAVGRSKQATGSAAELLPDLQARIARRYAHESATRWRGKFWATEIKRLVDLQIRDEEREVGAFLVAEGTPPFSLPAEDAAPSGESETPPAFTAIEEGSWLHAILEAIDLIGLGRETSREGQQDAVLATARELARRGRLPQAWITPQAVAPAVTFIASPLAEEMCGLGKAVEREVSFSLRMHPHQLAPIWPQAGELPEEEWVLVQGQIDAIWQRPDGTHVVLDFKSDKVASQAEIKQRAEHYRTQMLIYREAALRLWRAERVECLFYFLRPGKAVVVD